MDPNRLEEIIIQHEDFGTYVNNLPLNDKVIYDIRNFGTIIPLSELNEFVAQLNNWNLRVGSTGLAQIQNVGIAITLDIETKTLKTVIIPLDGNNEMVEGGGHGNDTPPYHK